LFWSTLLSSSSQFNPVSHSTNIGPENLDRCLAVGKWQVCGWDVADDHPNPRGHVNPAWLDMEEEHCEDATHAATEVRIKNCLAPRERGNVSLGVVRHRVEQKCILLIAADDVFCWRKICGYLLTLSFDWDRGHELAL